MTVAVVEVFVVVNKLRRAGLKWTRGESKRVHVNDIFLCSENTKKKISPDLATG